MAETPEHILSAHDLSLEFVEQLFSRTDKLKRMRGALSIHERALEGETVANLFWEASTRTRVSFELAASRLGGRVINLTQKDSSVAKGESLQDTVATLRAMGWHFFVVRHGNSGEPARLAAVNDRAHVINAGDGTNEHPTQALLDAFTIRESKKGLKGVQVAILGDVVRSRVARSNLILLTKLGAHCVVSGPAELLPSKLDVSNAEIAKTPDEAVKGADVVMVLRLQREREEQGAAVSDDTYRDKCGVTKKRLALAKPDAIVMHPGPMMRGVEIDSDIADGPQSVILRQVENGLFMRMAIFEALRGEHG